MSKIARVKFIRDKEPNIKALTAENKVLDGALYIATDTGTMWMGTSATSLIQIKDNINTNTTYTLTKSGNTITLKGSDGSSVNVTDSNTIYNNATASAAGLMSAADKSKLDSVATGANKTVVDASFVANSTNPVQSKVVKSALDGKSDTGHKHVKADITDFPTSMPASDVSAWAKAATKPSYSKAEVGLGNVDNTADANKSVKYATSAGSASTATTVVNGGVASADVARHVWLSDSSNETTRVSDDNFKYNPCGNLLTTNISGNAATASSVAWGNVSGKPSAFTPASHTHDDRYYTESEINTKLNAKANSSHTHTKSQITDFPTSMPASDVYSWAKQSSKPSYTISEVSGNLPASRISGTIAAANLPSYVDDVLEYESLSKFPTTGESGKIYTALDTNKIYRWSGSAYVVISETIALGTTHSSAGYGDESRAAYNHSTKTSGNPHHVTKTDVGLGNVENKSSATIRGELTSANVTTALGYTPPKTDTNTHYTTRIVAGAANGTANASTTNGNTHINVTDDNTFRSGVVIKGTGSTSVTSDASGNITVHSTDTDTWRPIQNNLTSTATDQSLSAAQGKALNDKFSSYVPTSRTVNGKALSANISLSASDVGAAASSHSHNYAGSSSAGGAATSANKLNTNAGSGTQPVYFSNGIPVATTYSLNKSVPSNAVFTDTDVRNTAGSTNSSSKLFLVGAASQSANTQTYSNSSVYTKDSTIATNGIGRDCYIAYPSGGQFHTNTASLTGWVKVTLPVSWTSTMLSFTVSIFNYSSNTTVDYRVSGYNYSVDKSWFNCTAVCIGKAGSIHSNLPVLFGHDGSKCVIAIGATDGKSTWDYPQVSVHDVTLGLTNSDFDLWNDGWSISINNTPLKTTSATISNTHVGYGAVASYADNASKASSVPWSGVSGKPSTFTPSSHTHDDRYYTESEINSKLSGKANSSHTHTKSQITDFPTSMPASDVYAWAKASSKPSYSWSEISNKPSIPSVGNGTITITQNGATKGTFTLNQSGNATIALTDNNTVYSLPAATSSTLGGVKVGSNITNSSGTISLTKANVTAALGYTPPTSDTNTWRPEEVIISSTQPSANTCKLWIKI